MTSWESKASPRRSAWTSFMALSCRRLLMLEKMDSFHVSSISWGGERERNRDNERDRDNELLGFIKH